MMNEMYDQIIDVKTTEHELAVNKDRQYGKEGAFNQDVSSWNGGNDGAK